MAYRDKWVITKGGPVKILVWEQDTSNVRGETRLEEPKIDEEIVEIDSAAQVGLKEKGYEVVGYLGSGQMRNVFHVIERRGNAVRAYAAKVPRLEGQRNTSSVNTHIALHKGRNWDGREVDGSNKLYHPNVAYVRETIKLPDGRTVNLEDYIPGSRSLRAEVKRGGGVRGTDLARGLLEGIIDGVSHIHANGLAHNDLKPENIVVAPDGRPIITDLQTVGDKYSYNQGSLMTRGKPAYSDPVFVNYIVGGRGGWQTGREKNDIFAVGGIAHYIFTGEDPNKINVRIDRSGFPVQIGEEVINVRIYDGDKPLDKEITRRQRYGQLKKLDLRMRELGISKPYRDLAIDCMRSSEDKRAINSAEDLKKTFKRLDASIVDRLKRRFANEALRGIRAGLWTAIPAGIASFLIGSCAYLGPFLNRDASFPVRHMEGGIMQREDHIEFDLQGIPDNDRLGAYRVLVPALRDIIEKLPELEKSDLYGKLGADYAFKDYAHSARAVNRRLASALVRTIVLHGNESTVEKYKKDGQDRVPYDLSPKSFLVGWYGDEESVMYDRNNRSLPHAVSYLRDCITHDYGVADTFARFFSGEEVMRDAMMKSRSKTYFAQYDDEGNMVSSGYRAELPDYQREMIDTAVGLYHATDEKTLEVNYQRLEYLAKQYGQEDGSVNPNQFIRWEQPVYGEDN